MRTNLFILSLVLFVGGLLHSCSDDDDNSSVNEEPITEQNVRAVFNFLPPNGYEPTFYQENLPAMVLAGYSNTSTDQNIAVQASENLTGDVISVDDDLIERTFDLEINEISKATINGTDVYEAMGTQEYRVVIFKGQYQFDVIVQNDPELEVAQMESRLFVEIMTDAMTTF